MRPRLKEAERREPHRAATLMTDLDAAISLFSSLPCFLLIIMRFIEEARRFLCTVRKYVINIYL